MVKCLCTASDCVQGFCNSKHGCYKVYRKVRLKGYKLLKVGCLTSNLSLCNINMNCCFTQLCNNMSLTFIDTVSEKPEEYYLYLSLKIILPICVVFMLFSILFVFFVRKYHYNLTKYLKICSSLSMSNEVHSFNKPYVFGNEENISRFIDNSSGLIRLTENIDDNKKVIQCDSCTSGSGSGMPFLVQRTIARQVKLLSIIGKGRFGEVWKGTYYGELVAVKIFASRDEISWSRETHIYNTFLLRHPNILGYYASDVVSMHGCTQLWLITHYHELGSLYDYLHTNIFSMPECLQILYSISAGLCHLHSEIVSGPHGKPAIAHRDLKSKNILVIRPGEACIADLGLSVIQPQFGNCSKASSASVSKHKVGTRRYMAPEILSDCVCSDVDDRICNEHQQHQMTFSCTTTIKSNNTTTTGSGAAANRCPIRFEHFLSADIFAFSLIMWEVLSRTTCNILVSNEDGSASMTTLPSQTPEYRVPFHDRVPLDPTTGDMRQLLCVEKVRPPLSLHSNSSLITTEAPGLTELQEIIRECWADKSHTRPLALRVKKNLKSILLNFYTL